MHRYYHAFFLRRLVGNSKSLDIAEISIERNKWAVVNRSVRSRDLISTSNDADTMVDMRCSPFTQVSFGNR